MESSNYDGGPAMPCPTPHSSKGLSLRDWFAGMALAGIVAKEAIDSPTAASWSFQYADAMLAERAKRKGGAA